MNDLPAAYGFAPKRKPKPVDGPLYAHPVGALADADPAIRAFALDHALDDVLAELALHVTSGDPVHLWRAWRTARVFGDVPPALLVLIAPHLDAMATCESTSSRVEGREATAYMLADYDAQVERDKRKAEKEGRPTNLTECRRRTGARWGKTEGAVNQAVLKRDRALGR